MTQQPLISHRALIQTWPGYASTVGQALARLVDHTRPLRGCLAIEATRLEQAADGWQLDLCWADRAAMVAWLAGPVAELFTRLVNQHAIMHIDFQPGAADLVELRKAS